MAVASAGKIRRIIANKWPRNHPPNIHRRGQFKGDLANFIKPLKAKMLFMHRDLEYTINRGIYNRFTGFDALFAQLFNHRHARGMFIAQNARYFGTFAKFFNQIIRKTRYSGWKITPININFKPANFPMACRCIFAVRLLDGITIFTDNSLVFNKIWRQYSGRFIPRQTKAKRRQIGQF